MKRNYGFTLIELMVTLVVAVILVVIAVPGFRTIIQNNRASTQANELLSAMTLARSEAIKRGTNVSVCSSTNQSTCAASTTWSTGWIVFVDINNNGTFDDDADASLCEVDVANLPIEDCILRTKNALDANSTLVSTSNDVRYLPTGLVTAAAANTIITMTLTPTPCKGKNIQTVTINATGRANSVPTNCP